MDLTSIPLMAALKQRMRWLNENQGVLSENVSHADTPGYKSKALEKQDFSGLIDNMTSGGNAGVSMKSKNARHMDMTGGQSGTFHIVEAKDREESPTGNSVVLEEEMLSLSENQMKYGMVVNLYKKNLGLLKKAMGRDGGR